MRHSEWKVTVEVTETNVQIHTFERLEASQVFQDGKSVFDRLEII